MESTPVLKRRIRPAQARGFTLIEMLVVLFIIALITAIVVSGQSNYNKTLLLTDTTYGVALSAREAQTFGLASRKFQNIQNPGYGLHIDRLNSDGSSDRYVLFADTNNSLAAPANCPLGTPGTPEAKPGNCRYDNSSDGTVGTYTFSRGFQIRRFCGRSGITDYCSTYASPLTSIDMVFTRPNTTTTISGIRSGVLMSFSCATILISDASQTATREIRISSVGEISIATPYNPCS